MRLMTAGLVLGALLAVLITWLMIQGSDEMDAAYFETRRSIDAIALDEVRLRHEVLRARIGRNRDDGRVAALVASLRGAAARLENAAGGDDEASRRSVAAAVMREIGLVERFEAENGLVRTSIAFFDSLDARSEANADPRLAQAVARFRVRVLDYVGDASAARLDGVRSGHDALVQELTRTARAAEAADVVLHGRRLLDGLPRLEALDRALLAASSEGERHALQTSRRAQRDRQHARADDYRVALFLVTLSLLVLLVRAGLLVRARTLILRRTIAFQTVIVRAANRFLASQPDELPEHIVDVLAMVGGGLGTDYGYVLMLDGSDTTYLWCRPGLPPPSGWPAARRDLIPDIEACAGELVYVEAARATGPPALHRALTSRGVVAWSCSRLRRGERIVGLLCFERSTTAMPAWVRQSRGLLQVVADSVAAALERQRIWAERREIEETLRRAQRLEAIGTFASGVAHNVNNVINVVLGHAEIAADAVPAGTRAAEQIDLLVQAGGRAREIVGQILDFGRRGRSARGTSVIDAVVTETVRQIRSSTAEPVAIQFTGSAGDALVGGEPAQLQQVVLNLIRNAAQASRPGDTVAVQLDRLTFVQPPVLSHGALRPGDYARLRIADAGHGMDAATQARIFEPFFTTRPAGTGLGLATAFEFIREQDGAVEVYSAPGAGSTFEVWLPVILPDELGASADGGTVLVLGRWRPAILEDEEMLAALGFEPVGYADPETALAALRAEPERFDALIVEGQLAGTSGLEFARRAKQIAIKPVVLSLSACETLQPEVSSGIPVVSVVRRPWSSEALSRALRRPRRGP